MSDKTFESELLRPIDFLRERESELINKVGEGDWRRKKVYDVGEVINFIYEYRTRSRSSESSGEVSPLIGMVSLLEQLRKGRDKARRELRRRTDPEEQNYVAGRADAFSEAIRLLDEEAN